MNWLILESEWRTLLGCFRTAIRVAFAQICCVKNCDVRANITNCKCVVKSKQVIEKYNVR